MKKLTKIIALTLAMLFIITSASCRSDAGDGEGAAYHIGIVTLSTAQAEDELRGAEACITAFGNVQDGGMIQHVVMPDNFSSEQETVISSIVGLSDDPLMKAIIVNPAVQGTAAAFQRIRELRDDIILIAGQPQDDPLLISSAADFCVDSDNFVRGYYDILRASNMGAKTFVHMSFPRHMGMQPLARRKAMFEEACKDFGIEFVDVTVPDPSGEIGIPGAQQSVYDMMPQLIDQYGVDSVYFTTNTALHDPIIERVAEYGAMFVVTDDVSPLVGYPTGLGVDLSAEAGDWDAIIAKIEEAAIEQGLSGRMGAFKYSLIYCHSEGLVRLAKDIIDGTANEDRMQAVTDAYGDITNSEWKALLYEDANTGEELQNFYTLAQDVYIFGEGLSGVMDVEIPEKYYSIK
ncbi:MAG: DUF3798 domain-containing protein [Clostridiales bacterium]|jgi:hypothetical protein|nr:DUF3798 domain-containing protein [Clostridiales bacterium]